MYRSHKFVAFLLTILAASSTCLAAPQNAKIQVLVIEGIGPATAQSQTTIKLEGVFDRQNPYLAPKIGAQWDEFAILTTNMWSGDINDTEKTVSLIKGGILGMVRYTKKLSAQLVIVGHSWGSVLVYRALQELYEERQINFGDVTQLVTLGSPLNSRKLGVKPIAQRTARWNGAESVLGAVRVWRNYWIDADTISNPIPGLAEDNIELPYSGDKGGAHSAYYDNGTLVQTIGRWIHISSATPELM